MISAAFALAIGVYAGVGASIGVAIARNDIGFKSDGMVSLTEFRDLPDLKIGDEVEVAHGPFQGMQGTVLAVPSATERVKILLEFLGTPQAVDMDLFSILLPRRPMP